jgi:bifunctional oligoribonuclease and PAP phosphatase NrnA
VTPDPFSVPEHRRATLDRIIGGLEQSKHIILSTHVNADGDGAGCEAAVAAWLTRIGKTVSIVNPTAFPDNYRFLITQPEWIVDLSDAASNAVLKQADTVLVLDTGEPKRIGKVAGSLTGKAVYVLDHHPPSQPGFQGVQLLDPDACATGELVYDLFLQAKLGEPWPEASREGLYTAIVTDTGSFRFSNTTPRAHALAGDLIRRGVDPELAYRRLFGTVPLRRIELLRQALASLEVDAEQPITSVSIGRGIMDETGATADDLEGLVEHARSIAGTEVALLFRETSDGGTKVSLRSNGELDVNAIARQFGGGGHIKASGAVIGAPLASARARVIEATRAALAALRSSGTSR